MERKMKLRTRGRLTGHVSGKTLLAGAAVGLAAAAWLWQTREPHKSRRYADHHQERRNPLHFFLAGRTQQRREIDRSGKHPLFERRQSVYDAY